MAISTAFEGRINRIRKVLNDKDILTAILLDPATVLYFTGYWTILSGSTPSALLLEAERATLIIPALEQAAAQSLGLSWLEVAGYRNYPLRLGAAHQRARVFSEVLSDVLERSTSGLIGIELDVIRESVGQLIRERKGQQPLVDITPYVRGMRAEKETYEVSAIRRAATIAAEAIAQTQHLIKAGNRETDLSGGLAGHIWAQGGRTTHIVVGSGSRSSLAHPLPTDRSFRPGDLVLIDIGVLYEGYWAEIARTFVVGAPSSDQQFWYTIVLESQAEARGKLRPGAAAAEVDAAARHKIFSAGFDGVNFNHALGHGVGLLGMDPPLIAPDSGDAIPRCCAVTLEPALYFEGRGGVRTEDTYLISERGVESLTGAAPSGLA